MAETQKAGEDELMKDAEGRPSAVGNVADLAEGQVLLPSFVTARPDGLFVDAAAIAGGDGFAEFVERVFSSGARFAGLDYGHFQSLLHQAAAGPLRLADAVVPFAAERRALYRDAKISPDGQRAEYMFEPAALECVAEEPVPGLGEAGEAGAGPSRRVVAVPTRLDFDEFVAAMWAKGLRFGIDEAAVRGAIARGDTVRLEVARWQPPTPGTDATLIELTEALHRDDSPRILSDGRVDLRHFKNRFPQIAAGELLLKKIPRVPGQAGRKVDGEAVEPALPADFDLNRLAGAGTRVESRREGECIASVAAGFLTLDAASGEVSVTEKIVSREGVSVRTTGNLVLSGDDYEESGDVQEKCVVEGKNMSFLGNVYGEVVSRGGRIHVASNLSGGRAASPRGEIRVDGRMSSAVAEAPGGEVRLKYAEGSTIVASRVFVEEAVYCQILAEEIEIGRSEGSALAARSIRLGTATSRREAETIVAMLVPDLSDLEQRMAETTREQEAADRAAAAKTAELDGVRHMPEVAKFLALEARIRKGEVRLNPTQEATWRLTVARFAPVVRRLGEMQKQIQGLTEECGRLDRDLGDLRRERQAIVAGIACTIEEVAGDTLVRVKTYQPDADLLLGAQAESLRAGLRDCGLPADRLFLGDSGEFSWRYQG